MTKVFTCPLLAAALLVSAVSVQAEDTAPKYTFTPYVWATDLETTAGGSELAATSEIDFDDLLSIVDAAWMSMFEVRFDSQWSLINDIVYMKISDSAGATGRLGFLNAEVDGVFEQGTVDLFAGYTPDDSRATFFAGFRYIFLDAAVDLDVNSPLPTGGFTKRGSREDSWIDPVVGVRYRVPLSEALNATVQADVGGGLDSEFSSVTTVSLDYALTEAITLRGGYRYARIDKDDSDLLFDQTAQGFLLAAGINF